MESALSRFDVRAFISTKTSSCPFTEVRACSHMYIMSFRIPAMYSFQNYYRERVLLSICTSTVIRRGFRSEQGLCEKSGQTQRRHLPILALLRPQPQTSIDELAYMLHLDGGGDVLMTEFAVVHSKMIASQHSEHPCGTVIRPTSTLVDR